MSDEVYQARERELHSSWLRGELAQRYAVGSREDPAPMISIITEQNASRYLTIAARDGHDGVVAFLLDSGARQNVDAGTSPLNEACRNGHKTCVEALVENDGRPNADMLLAAVSNGHIDVARYLAGLGIRLVPGEEAAVLCSAASQGDLVMVRFIVGKLGVAPSRPEEHGALAAACLYDRPKVALYLMSKGAAVTREFLGGGRNRTFERVVADALLDAVKLTGDCMVAVWRRLHLGWINFSWFFHPVVPGAHFVEVDLSDNHLYNIPGQMLSGGLPMLQRLNLSHNVLKRLPRQKWNSDDLASGWTPEEPDELDDFCSQPPTLLATRLTDLDVSYNDLTEVPGYLFQLSELLRLNLSHNALVSLEPVTTTAEDDPQEDVQEDGVQDDIGDHEDDLANSTATESPPSSQWIVVSNDDHEQKPKDDDDNDDYGDGDEIDERRAPSENSSSKNEQDEVDLPKPSQPIPWKCTRLEKLDISHNFIADLSGDVCKLKALRKLRINHNHLRTLPPVWRTCRKLVEFKASVNFLRSTSDFLVGISPLWRHTIKSVDLSNNKLTEVPIELCRLEALELLDLSGNYLTTLPNTIPWSAPYMSCLRLAHNFFGRSPEADEEPSGKKDDADVGDSSDESNRDDDDDDDDGDSFFEIPRDVPRGASLGKWMFHRRSVTNEQDQPRLRRRASSETAVPSKLRSLELIRSLHRGILNPSPTEVRKVEKVDPFFRGEGELSLQEQDKHFYLPPTLRGLKTLDISYNCFAEFPLCICYLPTLEQLDLSRNSAIRRIPLELSWNSNLWWVLVNDLKVDFPAELIEKSHGRDVRLAAKKTLRYMSRKLRHERTDYFMKIVIVGDRGSGKTSLADALCSPPGEPGEVEPSQPGVTFQNSVIYKRGNVRARQETDEKLECLICDVTDKDVYSATKATFFASCSIHVIVWNMRSGDQGVFSISEWLQEIPASHGNSRSRTPIVVVGTNEDALTKEQRSRLVDSFENDFIPRHNLNRDAVFLLSFTSRQSWRIVEKLRLFLYETGRKKCSNYLQVPAAYIQLRRHFKARCSARLGTGRVQPFMVHTKAVCSVIESLPTTEIKWVKEIPKAIEYLQKCAVLVHFDDPLDDLSAHCLVDVQRLCEKIGVLVMEVAKTEVDPQTGLLHFHRVAERLCDDYLDSNGVCAFLRFLEKMGIIYPTSQTSYLLPSILPDDRPNIEPDVYYRQPDEPTSLRCRAESIEDKKLQRFATVERVYILPSMPSDFFSHLVARVKSSYRRWKMSHLDDDEGDSGGDRIRTRSSRAQSYLSAFHDRLWLQSQSIFCNDDDDDEEMKCWRHGLVAFHDSGNFRVERILGFYSFGKCVEADAIHVTVYRDFSALCYVIDQIETLLRDWFPQFSTPSHMGDVVPLKRLVVNPLRSIDLNPIPMSTVSRKRQGSQLGFPAPNFLAADPMLQSCFFTVEECCLAWLNGDVIKCPSTGRPLSLKSLIPDVLLRDAPGRFVVKKAELSFEPTAENCIGYGGEGDVFRSEFRGQTIAIKVYRTVALSGDSLSPSTNVNMSGSTDFFLCSGGGTTARVNLFQMSSAGEFPGQFTLDKSANQLAARRSKCAMDPPLLSESMCSLKRAMRGSTVADAFWQLRRETTVLRQLRHPCVVPLIGFCIRPLCLLLEYAPLGSLSAVLRRFTSVRPAADGVLGRVLTYKIAYQVAHALQHLHRHRVVYLDLKASNVLLYTFDIDADVNIKITDYGISQLMVPGGIKGTVGTPGFQAPEIITQAKSSTVFDQKVDIFSYAMFVSELLVGHRPWAHTHYSPLELPEKIVRGERPPLPEDDSFSRLHTLVKSAWEQEGRRRPAAARIVTTMKEPSFVMQHRRLDVPRISRSMAICSIVAVPPADVSSALDPTESDQLLSRYKESSAGSPYAMENDEEVEQGETNVDGVLWVITGDGENRRLSVVDARTGKFYAKDSSFAGMKVVAMAGVGGCQIWLGFEEAEVWVYSSSMASSRYAVWELLWKSRLDASVKAIMSQASTPNEVAWQYRVFVALDDGTITVFYGTDTRSRKTSETCDAHPPSDTMARRFEARRGATASWMAARRREARRATNLPLIEDKHFSWERVSLRVVRPNHGFVTCMTTSSSSLNDNVWCGAGWKICVLATDFSEMSKLKCIASIPTNGLVSQLVSLAGHVWVMAEKQTLLWAYDAASYELKCVVDCRRVASDDVFPAALPCFDADQSKVAESNSRTTSELRLFAPSEASPETSRASATLSLPVGKRPRRGASAALQNVFGGYDNISMSDSILAGTTTIRRSLLGGSSDPNIQAIVVVRDTIWVGRQNGDILVLDGNVDFPRVVTCLEPESDSPLYGCPVQSLTVLSTGLVVACRQQRTEGQYNHSSLPSRVFDDYFCVGSDWSDYDDDVVPLDVWQAWDAQDLAWLRRMQAALGENEAA